MTIRQKVNLDTMESFRNFLNENPDKGKLHLEARAVYQGQAGQCQINVGRFSLDDEIMDQANRNHSIQIGVPRQLSEMIGMESVSDNMEPVEMALASTAACLVHSVTLNAARMGINTTGLEITVRTTVDPRMLLALESPEKHRTNMGAIEFEVIVGEEVSDEEMEMIHKLCRYSPVRAMMSEAIEIKGDVTRA
jgi:uncharacterized OsmC-like protein